MIKKSKVISRFGKPKTLKENLIDYAKTILASLVIALIFVILLFVHARSEMIKNLYINPELIQKANESIAMSIVTQSDLTKNLANKNYSICMNVGDIYDMAKEYKNAQYAYELAISKTRYGNFLPHYKLAKVLIAQNKFDEANKLIESVTDVNDKKLVKLKTRAYIDMGDKLYSIGKSLSAAKNYEKANFYYNKFVLKDPVVEKSIVNRVVKAYIETADVLVKNGYNSDAVRFLTKAEKFKPNDFTIRYKLAIIYSDLDPIKSTEYFESLLQEQPQNIDYSVYSKALMKAANIKDWQGEPTKAKYYRYKIHSIDLFANQKVVYANDLEILLDKFFVKKIWFAYKLKGFYRFKNVSYVDIQNLSADFVLRKGDKVLETVTSECVSRKAPLYSNGGVTNEIKVVFHKNILTRKELSQYKIDIFLYKNERYKTLVSTMRVPLKTIK